MNKYQIVTDSSCDLPQDVIRELDLKVIDLEFMFDGEESCANGEMDVKEFYAKMRSGAMVKTSAANMDMFMSCFEEIAKEGKDILYVGFSSGLSSTCHTGSLATEEIMEKYPNIRAACVDTLAASLGEGLLVYYAAMMQKDGKTLDEVVSFLEDKKLNLCHWFTVDDLFFLKRGGRVNAATAVVGSLLAIKPILHVDNDGHLISVGKVRGRRQSVEELFHRMEKTVVNPDGQAVFISHGDCLEEAEELAAMIKEKWNVGRMIISEIGPVIGAHSGPGTMALFYLGSER